LGFKLDNPANLREKHFEALLEYWLSKELSSATIQKRTSVLRVFCTWIGRPGMIKTLKEYVEDASLVTRKQAAQEDKSWIGNGVSFQDILKLVDAYDSQAGAQLRIINAFGLRREEAICLQPIRAMKLGDHRESIFVEKGTKNGLKRYVSIDNEEKREALANACQLAKVTDAHIGWEGLTLKQAVKRMANIMQKFGVTKKELGVTLHGLRHERLQDIHEEITGEPCAIRGGKLENIDPELELKARHIMTTEAGHARLDITTAYSGSFKTTES
jgi:integrase